MWIDVENLLRSLCRVLGLFEWERLGCICELICHWINFVRNCPKKNFLIIQTLMNVTHEVSKIDTLLVIKFFLKSTHLKKKKGFSSV